MLFDSSRTTQPSQLTINDDDFERLAKGSIVSNSGLSYAEFRKHLKPKWSVVWAHIAMGWLVLITANILLFSLSGSHHSADLLLAIIGSVVIGYCVAYLQLFFHEAAHYNLHPNRDLNDILCNIFIGSIVGQDIRHYRPIHWDHHKYLGTNMDTEITYMNPLNFSFLVESLLGIRAAKVLMLRKSKLEESKLSSPASSTSLCNPGNFTYVIVGILLNLVYLIALLFLHAWPLMAAWILGILVFFPLFASLRQLSEHRDEHSRTVYGYNTKTGRRIATNRLFGDGPIASTLGGAGFNRHLLHHWDSQISYTRLPDLENFLMKTHLAPYLRSKKSTYTRTFKCLFRPVWV